MTGGSRARGIGWAVVTGDGGARGKSWAREVVGVYAMQIAGEARHDLARGQSDESKLGAVAQDGEERVVLQCRERDKWFRV